MTRNAHAPARRRTATLHKWCPYVLLLAAGCRTPAAHFATTAPQDSCLPCSVVFARQIAEDSAVELSCHPLRTVLTVAVQSGTGLWTVGRGAYGKRIAMPLAGKPPPLAADGAHLDAAVLDTELEQLVGPAGRPAQVRLHSDGADALAALKRILSEAELSIDVLMFQWENDALGADIAALVAAKAEA